MYRIAVIDGLYRATVILLLPLSPNPDLPD